MVLHGTYDMPEYLKNGPRKYEENAIEIDDSAEKQQEPEAFQKSSKNSAVNYILIMLIYVNYEKLS